MFSMATALRPQVKLFRDTINTKDTIQNQKKGMVFERIPSDSKRNTEIEAFS